MYRLLWIEGCAILFILLAAASFAQQQPQSPLPDQDSLEGFLRKYLREQNSNEYTTTQYSAAGVKLHGDTSRQVIVYLRGNGWCGSGGCTMLVLAPKRHSYRVISKTSITRLPIRTLKSRTNGWHDIGVWVQGGGIQRGYEAKLSFDGKQYPSNPSVPPAIKLTVKANGEVVIPSGAEGKALYP